MPIVPNLTLTLSANAGVQHVAPVESFPKEKWDHLIAINLSASFHTIQQALPKMRAKGEENNVDLLLAYL